MKLLFILSIIFSAIAWAGNTRFVDADTIRTSDHTATIAVPRSGCSSSTFWRGDGTCATPSAGGGSPASYGGTMVGVGGGWSNNTNTSYVDFSAATTSNTLTQLVSSSITCSADAGKTPAISCTLPSTGAYFVCATGTGNNNSSSTSFFRLVDGSTTIINGGQSGIGGSSSNGPFSLCGVYNAASIASAITFKLQGNAAAGAALIIQDSREPITWSVVSIH